jgi:hypothetical protein
VVAAPQALRARDGMLVIAGTDPVLTDSGVDMADGTYRPTAVCDEGVSDKLGIDLRYLRKLRDQAIDLYDVNVNGWLGRCDPRRKFLVRCFRGRAGTGVARALLSDGYKRIDHLDVLTAILGGVERAGVPVQVQGCDLTERRMYVRLYSDQVVAHAPAMLAGYRSPFTGAEGAANPVVWGGLVITNSETGYGAATITPHLVVQVCANGYTITADAHRAVHLGGRLSEGVIDWSADTQRRNLDLITAKARDAVTRFPGPRLRSGCGHPDRAGRRGAGRPAAGHDPAGVPAAAVLRRDPRRDPGPLHQGRVADRGRGHARGHQRRPDPR